MLATASAQVCVPLGHSSLYFMLISCGIQHVAFAVLFTFAEMAPHKSKFGLQSNLF